ncbi:hypothetical protein I7I51_04719 [Histoplasma capsulatum]|uniref:Uncharacterized protein n=1 Tax=Ajellomyces capsulatus TaxID=5037 RepID=A0A8A1M5A0_AJECA|nr:predicted protein [Histoplasma mississippiense (nom. inval.)]EDN09322.1 predicted protein [Histoplasma mississippiense (nom. inval.)]QSS59923.1 hypothetical protein I7I51_04719 [Histoplasma capsulatum]
MKLKSGSKIPTARYCALTFLTILPANNSAYHPTVSHSQLHDLVLDDLDSSTTIQNTYIWHSTLKSQRSRTGLDSSNNAESSGSSSKRRGSSSKGSSTLSHSHISRSTVSSSNINHTNMRRVTVSNAEYILGSHLRRSTLSGTGRITHSKLSGSEFLCMPDDNNNIPTTTTTPNPVTNIAKTEVDKSNIRNSIVGPLPCTIKRSKLDNVKISQSMIEDSSLKDCDIEGCQISKGKFSGLWLRNGVWEDGELVGEVRKGEGVVLKAKNFAEIEEREKERERERSRRAEGEKRGQERGIGIGGGTKGGMEDPLPIPASAGAQGDNVLLVGISSGEASGFICPPQGNFTHANPPQIPPPNFDSLDPTPAAESAAAAAPAPAATLTRDQHQNQRQAPPLPSKNQPHISTQDDCPSSPSTDTYSSAAESLLDPDEEGEFVLQDLPDVSPLCIDDDKPPPYTP